jgi:PAS domain S-box-containing protein
MDQPATPWPSLNRSAKLGAAGPIGPVAGVSRAAGRPIRSLVLTTIVLVCALIAGAVGVSLDHRSVDIAAADHETASLAVALAEQTNRTLGAVDFVLRDLLERISAADIASPEALNAQMGTHDVQRMLGDEVAALGQIDSVSVIGADGRLVNFSRLWPIPNTSLADRAFFRVLREGEFRGLYISDPIVTRATGLPTIYLARRIEAPDGTFIGVVSGSIRLDYFRELYKAISDGDGCLVALRKRNGSLLARFPETVGALEPIPPNDVIFQRIGQGAPSARVMARSPVDGTMRQRSAQVVADFPLVVVVGRTEASILADWRRQTWVIAIGTAIAVIALVTAIILLCRQIGRRETSEAMLTATLENVSQGIMMIDGDRRVVVCNHRANEMLQVPSALMSARPLLDDILNYLTEHGEYSSNGYRLEEALHQVELAGEIPKQSHTHERRRPNGTVIEIINIPLASGGVVRTYTDVTNVRERETALQAALRARDKAEMALRTSRDEIEREMIERTRPLVASEARHRDVADVSSDWFWETDAERLLTFVSKRFGETSGLPWAQVVGRAFDELVTLGFDAAGMAALRATFDAGATFHDVVHRVSLPDGHARFWRMGGKPFYDPTSGDFAGYRGTGTDVTVAIEHETAMTAALQRAEAAEQAAQLDRLRLTDAIEAIPQGFVLHDAEDRLVLCNTRYREIYGMSPDFIAPGVRFEDTLRRNIECGLVDLGGRDIEGWVTERMALHRCFGGHYIEHHLSNGVWVQAQEARTSDGGTVGIRIDVTAARRREAREREREKLAALGQLAGGVAHEINNLLQPAISLPELVADRLPPDDVESREDLDCVVQGARKIRDIVRNILLYARNEEPRLVPLDLVPELRSSLAFVRDLLPPAVSVREGAFAVPPGVCIAANKTQLSQVLTNLLVNAAQAMKGSGSVTVSVTRAEPTAEQAAQLGLVAGRGYVATSVADDGCGMDQATQARIFEPFFTTKPLGEGTGLGLSVAYGILRSWQGAISVHSAVGKGTTFVLYVPVLDEAA